MQIFTKFAVITTTAIIVATMPLLGSLSAQQNAAASLEPGFKNVEISRHQDVLILRINTPPRNVVSKATLSQINKGLDIAAADKSVGAIVITGSDRVFSSGAGGESLQPTPEGKLTHSAIAHRVYRRIEGFPKPVIAAIAGISAGGGNELAMSCDIRIAGKSAKFRQHELQAGLIPGFGGMQRLQRLVGSGRAMEIMLTGRFIEAEEALSIGLVTSVVADSKVVPEAISLGQRLHNNLASHALAEFKQRMSVSYDEPFSVALRNDQLAFDRLAASEETKTAIARFIQQHKDK